MAISTAQGMRIEKKIDDLTERVTRYEEQADARQEKIGNLEHDMYGNDTPGLKSRVQSVEQHCETVCAELDAQIKKTPSTFKKILVATLPNIISALILAYIFWQLFVYSNLHKP